MQWRDLNEKGNRVGASSDSEKITESTSNATTSKTDVEESKKDTKNLSVSLFDPGADQTNLLEEAKSKLWLAQEEVSDLKEIVLQSTQGHYAPGEILVASKDSFLLGCKKGCLRINQVQAPSKKQVDGASYLNGKKLRRADILV